MFSFLLFSIIFANGVIGLTAQTRPPSNGDAEKYYNEMSAQAQAAPAPRKGYNAPLPFGSCKYFGNVEHCDTRCDQYNILFTTNGCDTCYCQSPFSRHCDLSKCQQEQPKPTFEEIQEEFMQNSKNQGCKLVQVENKLYSMCPYDPPNKNQEQNDSPNYPPYIPLEAAFGMVPYNSLSSVLMKGKQ